MTCSSPSAHTCRAGVRSPSAARNLGAALMLSLATAHAAAAPELLRAGNALPPLEGESLTGRPVVLPSASAGTVTLILMGFTYASRVPVEAWGGWFRDAVGADSQVTFFEMPMIGGLARLGRWFIDRGMRRGTPAELHEHVVTVYSNAAEWRTRLGVCSANEDDAFLILLDRKGIVRWLHHGPFEAAPAAELTDAIASLVAAPSAGVSSTPRRPAP